MLVILARLSGALRAHIIRLKKASELQVIPFIADVPMAVECFGDVIAEIIDACIGTPGIV